MEKYLQFVCNMQTDHIGNHVDKNNCLNRHLAASWLRVFRMSTTLCLFLKIKKNKQDSTKLTCISNLYTEIGSLLFKPLKKKFASLLDKLLANIPQEHLRRVQIVCRSMSIFVIKWKCCTQVMLMLFLLLLKNINFRAAVSIRVELSNMLLNNCWETFLLPYWSQMNFPITEPLKVFVTAERERREEWEKVYCGI